MGTLPLPRDDPPAPPLAERLRPKTLDEVIGQQHLLGPGKPLRSAFESGRLHSMILWGPPGVGKTTLARLMADAGIVRHRGKIEAEKYGIEFHRIPLTRANFRSVLEPLVGEGDFVLNLAALPVATVPAGLDADGLPVGLQVLGPPRDEEGVLALAARVQDLRPVGLPPPGRRA